MSPAVQPLQPTILVVDDEVVAENGLEAGAVRIRRSRSLRSTGSITQKTISTGRPQHASSGAAPRQNRLLLYPWGRGRVRRLVGSGRPLPQRPPYLISPHEEPGRPVAAPQGVKAFKGCGCLLTSEAL
jgi:hypothetical protein